MTPALRHWKFQAKKARKTVTNGVKDAISLVLGLMVFGTVMATIFGVPAYQNVKFNARLHTHYKQAFQAATPREFADALWSLDNALKEFGMIQGDTTWSPYRQQNDMAFKRLRFRELAARADALARSDVSPADVSTGLVDMRTILANVGLPVYGFWMWSQGGVWISLYIPFIIFGVYLLSLIVIYALPETHKPVVATRYT